MLRGLRQGDPFSPFLFPPAANSLSQVIVIAKTEWLFKGFQVGSDKVKVSHLQFANDSIILVEGHEKNVLVLKSLIQCFELVSGFKVNWAKSHLSGCMSI